MEKAEIAGEACNVLVGRNEYWGSRLNGRFLIYSGPNLRTQPAIQEIKTGMRKCGALGAMWHYDYDVLENANWFGWTCDIRDYDIEILESKSIRKALRRSLRRCEHRRVDLTWLAQHGYKTYVNAATRYRNFQTMPQAEWERSMLDGAGDSRKEVHGVFVGGALAAYGLMHIWGKTVQFRTAKFDPTYASAEPMYCLYYFVARHYLTDLKYDEVYHGMEPLFHDTDKADLLLRLGRRRVFLKLGLYLVWPIRVLLCMLRHSHSIAFLPLAESQQRMIKALWKAQNIEAGRVPLPPDGGARVLGRE